MFGYVYVTVNDGPTPNVPLPLWEVIMRVVPATLSPSINQPPFAEPFTQLCTWAINAALELKVRAFGGATDPATSVADC